MISIKTDAEIELLRISGKILSNTLKELEKHIKAGVSTKQLNDIAHCYIVSNNATPSCLGFEGYPESICTSINEEVVHGIPSRHRILKDGDIISIDICVTYKGMVTDAARTYLVGNVSPEVKQLVEVTKECFFKGIENIKEGSRVGDIGAQVYKHAKSYGYGVIRDLSGHGVGYSVHEDPCIPNFGTAGTGARLYANQVIAVEPMISLGNYKVDFCDDGWTCVTRDGKPASHYENTIVITKNGVEILTE